VKKWGIEVPTRSMSLDEGEMDRGKTLPTPSPPRVAPSLPQGATPLLTGPMVGKHQSKCLRAEGGPPHGSYRQLSPTLVTPDHKGGGEDPFICTGGREMGSAHQLGAQHALEVSAAVATISSPCFGESGSLPKKAHTKGWLSPFGRYVHVQCHEPFFIASHLLCLSVKFDGL
jgi:hypothetical protein